ncbi:hypothetical protein GCM10010515_67840 [Streptomyces fructofermentans]|uniref:Uncharacterized protein n=1 Tax=Streptomyces fructofermentans TaxID=152141 RepID=A0A918U4V9_9ACTN|nr:hypothetical protein GCM10010515_67840 [Streptomyces fructofermentans]
MGAGGRVRAVQDRPAAPARGRSTRPGTFVRARPASKTYVVIRQKQPAAEELAAARRPSGRCARSSRRDSRTQQARSADSLNAPGAPRARRTCPWGTPAAGTAGRRVPPADIYG